MNKEINNNRIISSNEEVIHLFITNICNDESLINVLISAIKYFKYYNIKIKIRDYEENTNSF